MQGRSAIIVGAAIFLGLIAVFLANSYFSGVETRQEKLAEESRMARIVVASQDLAFGTPVSQQNVRLANWPANSVPAGAFTSIEEATKARVALRPIVPGEPVLASKVSGANGRATLSANLPEGQLAFSIPISAVAGAGGFIRPGDVVDVLLTRQIPGEGAQSYDKMVDVVLSSVQVLGIDTVADEKDTKPAIGKTATLQVDTLGAQKLALSTQLGTMSLALRNVADQALAGAPTVTRRDISRNRLYIGPRNQGGSAPAMAMARAGAALAPMMGALAMPPRPMGPTMTIVRGTKISQEEVKRVY